MGLDVRPELLEVLRQDEQVVPHADLVPHVPAERRLQLEAQFLEHPPGARLRLHHLGDHLLEARLQGVEEQLVGEEAPHPLPVEVFRHDDPDRPDVLHPPAEVLVQRGVRHDVVPLPGDERVDPVVVELGRPPLDDGGVRHVVLEEDPVPLRKPLEEGEQGLLVLPLERLERDRHTILQFHVLRIFRVHGASSLSDGCVGPRTR